METCSKKTYCILRNFHKMFVFFIEFGVVFCV